MAPTAEPVTGAAPGAPSLRVLALGPLEIWRGGALLEPDAWRYAKPRELLLYLLAAPAGRTRDQIALVFWPEASATQAKNNFHVTLHHLRKTLGAAEWIAFEDDRYRVSQRLGLEFDAVTFEREMLAALRALDDPERVERLRAALALYRGDFLEEANVGDWHFELRDRLRRLWTDGMLALGGLLAQEGRDSDAADVYRRLVVREELHEEAYRRLMTSLARAGERAQAMRAYDRLATLLRTDLDAEPEPETTALRERIRKAAPV
jgi:DNA-binding SARP family transcriptional activator